MSGALNPMTEWFSSLTPSDWISLVSAVATVSAVIFAAWQVKLASYSHKHNQRAQKESLRPYMVAQILPPRHAGDFGRIEVTNYGKTAARNVTVTFDPELPRLPLHEINKNSQHSHLSQPTTDLIDRVFSKPFSTLAPGQEVESPYWISRKKYNGYVAAKRVDLPPGEEAANKQREAKEREEFEKKNAGLSADGFSEDTKAVIRYQDDEGNQYEDQFGLNPAILQGYTFIKPNNTTRSTP